MNRFISIGIAIAAAPAIVLMHAQWTNSPDTEIIASILFGAGLPLGGLLVLAGVIKAGFDRYRQSPSPGIEKTTVAVSHATRSIFHNGTFRKAVLALILSLGLFKAFLKTTPLNPGDQAFLIAVNAAWLSATALLAYVVISLYGASLTTRQFLFRLMTIVLLLVPVLFLGTCSHLVTSWRWGG